MFITKRKRIQVAHIIGLVSGFCLKTEATLEKLSLDEQFKILEVPKFHIARNFDFFMYVVPIEDDQAEEGVTHLVLCAEPDEGDGFRCGYEFTDAHGNSLREQRLQTLVQTLLCQFLHHDDYLFSGVKKQKENEEKEGGEENE